MREGKKLGRGGKYLEQGGKILIYSGKRKSRRNIRVKGVYQSLKGAAFYGSFVYLENSAERCLYDVGYSNTRQNRASFHRYFSGIQ